MRDTKLIIFLQSLDKKQLKRLQKFITSPYFNEQKQPVILLNLLIRYHPTFESKQATKEKIYQKLFGKVTYNDAKWRRLSSTLFKLCEQFLAHELFNQDQGQSHLYLLRYYEEKGLIKHFNTSLKALREQQNKKQYQDAKFFYYEYLICLQAQIAFVLNKEDVRTPKYNQILQHIDETLEHYYFLSKLHISGLILNHSKVVQFDFEPSFISTILEHLETKEHVPPLISMYANMLQMINNENASPYFQALKKALQENTSEISTNDLRALTIFARNYCIAQINQGQEHYLQEWLDIFKSELNNLVIDRDTNISIGNFKNAVTSALRLGALEWVESFIETFIHHLPTSQQTDVYHYSKAHLYFYQKKYNASIQLLYQAEFTDIFYKIGARKILLQIYHELDEIDARDNLINSLRVFIHSKKELISPTFIESIRNFLNFLTAISKLLPSEKQQIAALKVELENTRVVTEKRWLLEQLRQV